MPHNPLLIDIGALSCDCTDHALQSLAKAMSGEEDAGPDIWALHDSPFIQSLIELFSSRGLLRLEKVKTELNAWLAGKHHKPHTNVAIPTPDTASLHWTPDELVLVRIYLENLPEGEYSLSDWGLLVDYLVNRYMPAAELASEAEWLAVRAALMGKVQASLDGKLTVQQADGLMGAMPLTIQSVQQTFDFGNNALMNHVLDYGRLRCAEHVTQLTQNTRHRLKSVILNHQEQELLGSAGTKASLQTQLFDTFSILNRDWRRIAVTEAGDNANQGMIASLPPGTRVRRMERYRGACPYCKKIHGTIMTMIDSKSRNKDGNTQVWVGKNNMGRSGASRKRIGNELIERDSAERWWIPAGPVHPHCRGMWAVVNNPMPGSDHFFQAWLEQQLNDKSQF